MSASIQTQTPHELFHVGTRVPQLVRYAGPEQGSQSVEYWSATDPLPDSARDLANALLATLGSSFPTAAAALQLRRRMQPSQISTRHHSDLAVLYCPQAHMPDVQTLRAFAAGIALGLGGNPTDPGFGQATARPPEAMPMEWLLASPAAQLLGCKLADVLQLHVPGNGLIAFSQRYAAAPLRSMEEEIFEVEGRVVQAKVEGKFQSAVVDGTRSGFRRFRHPKVGFDAPLREIVGAAIQRPGCRLRMTIKKVAIHDGKAKAKESFSLVRLAFV